MKLQRENDHAKCECEFELPIKVIKCYVRSKVAFETIHLNMNSVQRGWAEYCRLRLIFLTGAQTLTFLGFHRMTEMGQKLVKNMSNAPKKSIILLVAVTSSGNKTPCFRFVQLLILSTIETPLAFKKHKDSHHGCKRHCPVLWNSWATLCSGKTFTGIWKRHAEVKTM